MNFALTLSYSKVDEKSLKFLELDNNISHPCEESINYDADQYVFKNHFNGKYNFLPWRFIYIIKILINEPLTFLLKMKNFIKNDFIEIYYYFFYDLLIIIRI